MMDSLLQRADQQISLGIGDMAPETYETSEQVGDQVRTNATAEHLFLHDRPRYELAATLSAAGYGINDIAALLRMTERTVMAIREREPQFIQIEQARLARRGYSLIKLTQEAIAELLSNPDRRQKTTLRDLATAVGVLTNSSQLLAGEATERVTTSEAPTRSPVEMFNDYLDSLKRVSPAVPTAQP
jgi:hypothetical protein